MRLTIVLVLLLLTAPRAGAQQPAAPTRLTLRGVVVTANDVPLARVRVSVSNELPVLSDARGRFVIQFERYPDMLQVRPSFAKAGYLALTPNIQLDQLNDEVHVRLVRGGAISGQVVDRTGARVMLASVTARRVNLAPSDSVPASASDDTDDLGEFRISGLAESAYVLSVRVPGAGGRGIVTATAPPDEQTVNVGVGAEIGNITLTIDVPPELNPIAAGSSTDPGPDETGSVRGRVTSLEGVPLARAVVIATRSGFPPRSVESDARGMYAIERLAPGEYTVTARRNGFIDRQYGQEATSTSGKRISVQKDQAVTAIDVTLARGGAIAGTIVDEFGEPVLGAAVNALELRMVAGRLRALRAKAARTDDRGQYRLFGLLAGNYIIQAMVAETVSAVDGYLPQYFPGAVSVDEATPTQVDLARTVGGIDLTLIPSRAQRITGILLDSAGRPASNGQLILMTSERSGGIQTEPIQTKVGNGGSFVFTNVAPGDYVVQAMAGSSGPGPGGITTTVARQFASSFVTVANVDPPPMTLRLAQGATLTGTVTYEGMAPTPAGGVTLVAMPTDFDRGPIIGAGSMGFSMQPDNTFEYNGVFGPSLLMAQPRNPEWYVKSITYKGRELADSSFDFGYEETFRDIAVVISGNGAAVTGLVIDERANPVRDYVVVLFATASEKWTVRTRWMKTARPSQDGQFKVTGVVPGEYWVVAIDRLDGNEASGDLQNPRVLESLTSRARRIALGEGQSQVMTLPLVRR